MPASPAVAPRRPAASLSRARDGQTLTVEAATRDAQERGVVLGIVSVCAVLGLLAVSYQVVRSTRTQGAQYALGKSLTNVSNKQIEFRSMMGRFASWPELRERGVRMESQHAVTKWNADGSHWFMAVRDGRTGIVCQRTGEMFDNQRTNRRTSCSSK
jgi:hypothetical protein